MEDKTSERAVVLVVDDIAENIQVLHGLLGETYKVKAATDGLKALQIIHSGTKPDIILLDVMMPHMDGFEVCRRLKADPRTSSIPVIFVTARTESVDEELGFELGAVDYITKPYSPPIVKSRVRAHLSLYDQQRHLEELVQERTREIEQTRLAVIRCLGKAAEYKDNETGMHVVRMSWYSKFLAEAAGANEDWVELLFNAAPMHDVGKIGIPDSILCKPGKLTPEENEVMRQHVSMGGGILGEQNSKLLTLAIEVAETHHEKWDGSGYPKGLKGEDIPLSGRIVAIADVFDALTSERPYKEAWTVEKALTFIEDHAGDHFDPEIAPLLRKNLPKILEIKNSFSG